MTINHKKKPFVCTAIDQIECFVIEGFTKTVLRAVITESNKISENYKEGVHCG